MKICLVLSIILFPCLTFAQPFLACDLPPVGLTIGFTRIEITTNPGPSQTVQEVTGIAVPDGVNFKLYDLTSLAPAKYSFRAKWADVTGWWSEFSDPFVSTKPVKPSGIRLIP